MIKINPQLVFKKDLIDWYLKKCDSIIKSFDFPLTSFHSLGNDSVKEGYNERQSFVAFILTQPINNMDNQFAKVILDYKNIANYEVFIKGKSLNEIKEYYRSIIDNSNYKNKIKKINEEKGVTSLLNNLRKYVNREVKKTIRFGKLSSEDKNRILISMNVKVCPYCNATEFYQYKSKSKKSSTLIHSATIDHYFNQSKYQLFSMSLYNFIPSCYDCNSLNKRSSELEYYLYNESMEDKIRFELESPNSDEAFIKFLFGTTTDGLKLNLKKVCNEKDRIKVENDINILSLDDKYCSDNNSFVLDEAIRVYNNKKLYANEAYKNLSKELNEELSKEFDMKGINSEKLILDFLGYNFDDKLNHKYSKMRHDIWKNNF